MANNVSVEISANVQGYEQGMNKATEATKKYETETRKVKDSTVSLNAELRKAKREAMDLAAGYAKLSAEEKKSQFGREMKRQLDEAKKSAAELIDLQGDIRTELKNLASDTRALNTLSEGFGVVMDVTSTTLGVIAQFTGEEEDARRAILAFTTAQSALSAVTKIANALQAQSNTMLAVGKVQALAEAAAIKIKTAAEGKGVVTTKLATAAQALFNKIAMANPYVLLATAILGVVGALGTFIAVTGRAKDAQEQENKATEDAKSIKESFYNMYNDKLSETMTNYQRMQTEWKNLKTEGEKNQWIHDNTDAFHELGFEITNTADAESVFVKNEAAVIESFLARAQAAAYAAQAAAEFNKALEGTAKEGELHSAQWFKQQGIDVGGRKAMHRNLAFENQYRVTADDERYIRDQRMQAARESARDLFQMQLAAEQKSQAAIAQAGVKTYEKERTKALKKSGGGKTSGKPVKVKVEPEVDKDSLEYAENMLKHLEEKRHKISIDSPELPELLKDIEYAQKLVEERKIKLKIEPELQVVQKLDEYEKQLQQNLNEAASNLVWSEISNQANDIVALTEAYENAYKALESYNDRKKSLLDMTPVAVGSSEVQKILERDVQHTIPAYTDAISKLQDFLLKQENWQILGQEGGAAFDTIIEKLQEYKAELQNMQDVFDEAMLTPQEKLQKKLEKTSDSISQIADAVAACGELFSALGDVADNEGLQVAGIVAKAVATVALSYAQALASCRSWIDWLAFGLTGLGTMVSMISQIKSATNSFSEGGIVGGNSYSGDRVMSYLNSGEMVLNGRQQSNLFDMIDKNKTNSGTQTVYVTGRVKGTDLLLVQKNTNKVLSRAGSSITIG